MGTYFSQLMVAEKITRFLLEKGQGLVSLTIAISITIPVILTTGHDPICYGLQNTT